MKVFHQKIDRIFEIIIENNRLLPGEPNFKRERENIYHILHLILARFAIAIANEMPKLIYEADKKMSFDFLSKEKITINGEN